ncbi:MAG TPA: isoprenylcysteine carboxylmethyltransferase family protein [Vicinamibacterales bacterium]|jgi:protein-S-isoprenylcysteine O-methyltransferase Ste14
MRLIDHFTGSGDTLFRWRGQLPLIMLPLLVLGLFDARLPASVPPGLRAWQVVSFLVALSGLALRVVAIGTAPAGTSERSTTNPRASRLRTTGVYSLVRHPLYLGNSLTAVGLACFTTTWYVPIIVGLASLLYHERIAAREEAFLEDRFGDQFRAWAVRVRAAIPRLSTYVPSDTPFIWRRVLGREFHGLLVIGAVLFVLDLARAAFATGRLVFDPLWTTVFGVTATVFMVCSLLKKHTAVLRVDD